MSVLNVQNPKNAVTVEGKFGSFQTYWQAFFSSIAKRFSAADTVASVASANASDLASVITLANETKAQLNALLTALKQ